MAQGGGFGLGEAFFDELEIGRLEETEAGLVGKAAHGDDFLDMIVEGAGDVLGEIAEGLGDAAAGEAGEVFLHKFDRAGVRLEDAGGDFEQGAFAGAVGSDDADDAARGDIQGDVLESPAGLGVVVADIFEAKQIIVHLKASG